MTVTKSIITLDGSLCCDSSMEQLTDILANIDGVDEARGSYASNKVTVTYRGDSVSQDDIAEEIGKAGVGVGETITLDVPGP